MVFATFLQFCRGWGYGISDVIKKKRGGGNPKKGDVFYGRPLCLLSAGERRCSIRVRAIFDSFSNLSDMIVRCGAEMNFLNPICPKRVHIFS